MIALLCEKRFENIHITDIIRKANVSRSTYYYHYYEQKEILQDLMNDMYQEQINYMDSLGDKGSLKREEVCAVIDYILDYMERNRKWLKKVILSDAEKIFRKSLLEIWRYGDDKQMEKFSQKTEGLSLLSQLYMNGFYQIVCDWIKADCKQDKQQLIHSFIYVSIWAIGS